MITDFIAHILYHQYLTFAIDLREFNVPYRVRIGKIMSMREFFHDLTQIRQSIAITI